MKILLKTFFTQQRNQPEKSEKTLFTVCSGIPIILSFESRRKIEKFSVTNLLICMKQKQKQIFDPFLCRLELGI